MYLLHHRLTCSHSRFEVHLFQRGPFPWTTMLSEIPAPSWPHPWLQSLSVCICSVVGLSMATLLKVLQHDFMQSHWCSKVYQLQNRLIRSHRYSEAFLLQHGPQYLQKYICRKDTDISTALFGVSCSQTIALLNQVHTGFLASPAEQHTESSDGLAIRQSMHTAMAAIRMFPGTVEWDDKQCTVQQCTKQWK